MEPFLEMSHAPTCRYFRGDIPCDFHKQEGVHCICPHYDRVGRRILIIKLGAIGDVIRTTPLLPKLKEAYPDAELTWLTRFPEVVPNMVDRILPFELKSILYLQALHFDILYNLDKEREACALAALISADTKRGFTLKEGKCAPINHDALDKYYTGLFDDVNRRNMKSYPQEIFEICGFEFSGERYILENPEKDFSWQIGGNRPLIGLNTGCGDRWLTRLWPEEHWTDLARRLRELGIGVILLGGANEHEKNLRIAKRSGTLYLGHFPLSRFISLVNQCDLVVTSVTMALHVAIGLGKKVVLFNNIFNRNEFELYGLGEILEPDVECLCCYKSTCEIDCLSRITVEEAVAACQRLLAHSKKVK